MGYSPWGHKESDTTEQLSTLTHDIESSQNMLPAEAYQRQLQNSFLSFLVGHASQQAQQNSHRSVLVQLFHWLNSALSIKGYKNHLCGTVYSQGQ